MKLALNTEHLQNLCSISVKLNLPQHSSSNERLLVGLQLLQPGLPHQETKNCSSHNVLSQLDCVLADTKHTFLQL